MPEALARDARCGFRAASPRACSRRRYRSPRRPRPARSTAAPKSRRSRRSPMAPGSASTWTARASPMPLVALGCTPAEMSWKAGVDVLCLRRHQERRARLRGGDLLRSGRRPPISHIGASAAAIRLSKGRLLGVQMQAYLDGGHWLELARMANAHAAKACRGTCRCRRRAARLSDEANESSSSCRAGSTPRYAPPARPTTPGRSTRATAPPRIGSRMAPWSGSSRPSRRKLRISSAFSTSPPTRQPQPCLNLRRPSGRRK